METVKKGEGTLMIFHPSGLAEIQTFEGLIILTDGEYARAKRRGESVCRNREAKHKQVKADRASLWRHVWRFPGVIEKAHG